MKHNYLLIFLFFCLSVAVLRAQPNTQNDTLIVEPVIGNPVGEMLNTPSGNDDEWVNYDQDEEVGFCVENGDTPLGWYVEIDYSFADPFATDNYCFTSCSYLSGGVRNYNWLILPPIQIPDSTFRLNWRSLAFEGPAFTDGYRVLASTHSNLPASGDFSTELFRAAETIGPVDPGNYTLDPADYIFSNGYIQANGYTDTNYYFFVEPDGPLRGKLEPHSVSLAPFAGQTIYLAFLHDSKDDSQLQIDDILVSNDLQTGTHTPKQPLRFDITPNPATSHTYVSWDTQRAEPGSLTVLNMTGRIVLSQHFAPNPQVRLYLNLNGLPPGIYQCVINTATSTGVRKLIKL